MKISISNFLSFFLFLRGKMIYVRWAPFFPSVAPFPPRKEKKREKRESEKCIYSLTSISHLVENGGCAKILCYFTKQSSNIEGCVETFILDKNILNTELILSFSTDFLPLCARETSFERWIKKLPILANNCYDLSYWESYAFKELFMPKIEKKLRICSICIVQHSKTCEEGLDK